MFAHSIADSIENRNKNWDEKVTRFHSLLNRAAERRRIWVTQREGAHRLALVWRLYAQLVLQLNVLWICCTHVYDTGPCLVHKVFNLSFKMHRCVTGILRSRLKLIKSLHLGHLVTLLRLIIVNNLCFCELFDAFLLHLLLQRWWIWFYHEMPIRFTLI